MAKGIVTPELWSELERITRALFQRGTEMAAEQGMILVDTKYEFGLRDGQLTLIDEIHTPDSSRYWYADRYEQAMSRGESPAAIDKEYVRLWLGEQGYKGDGPSPALPDDVRCEAARRYIAAYEQVSGIDFEADTEEPIERIRRNLLG